MYGFLNKGLKDLLAIQKTGKRSRRKRLSRRFRQRIFWRDGGKCVYCEQPVEFAKATMDHVSPLVGGGHSRSKENIVTACRNCNNKKAQLVIDDLQDLAPDALYMKFYHTTKTVATRKGHYPEYINSLT